MQGGNIETFGIMDATGRIRNSHDFHTVSGADIGKHRTGIAKTGVVGILKGSMPGPVIGLRADMAGLPVTERVNVPFKSVAKTEYNGQTVGVMHACGHDTHVAMLLGTATVL
ncbi:MAG: M20/M25/M40 family metallo-hydrolase, partial [Patescibacteria group bacterium]